MVVYGKNCQNNLFFYLKKTLQLTASVPNHCALTIYYTIYERYI